MLNYLTSILNNFYDKHGLEHACALEQQMFGDITEDQRAYLVRFCSVWDRAQEREYRQHKNEKG